MSHAPKKRDEQTSVSGIFSITPDPFGEMEIPGVTELLSRRQIEAKQKLKSLEPTRAIKTPPRVPTPPAAEIPSPDKTNLVLKSTVALRDYGVLFELRFEGDGHTFKYTSAQGHKEAKLLPWQEQIFNEIKMSKKSVPVREPFQEFRADEDSFLFDAFAIQSHHYIQIVSPEYSNTRIVLVSDQSLMSKQAEIVEHFSRG